MITCYSCVKSYEAPTDDLGGIVLLCSPDGYRVQMAEIPCLKYQRESGADEQEEVA